MLFNVNCITMSITYIDDGLVVYIFHLHTYSDRIYFQIICSLPKMSNSHKFPFKFQQPFCHFLHPRPAAVQVLSTRWQCRPEAERFLVSRRKCPVCVSVSACVCVCAPYWLTLYATEHTCFTLFTGWDPNRVKYKSLHDRSSSRLTSRTMWLQPGCVEARICGKSFDF